MYCSYCGVEILDSKQTYCQNCGNKIETIDDIGTKAPQVQPQTLPTIMARPSETDQTQQKQINKDYKEKGEPGPDSKKCLAFAIISIVLGIIGLYAGFITTIIRSGLSSSYYPSYMMGGGTMIIAAVTVIVVINIIGLIFGFVSLANGISAGKKEPPNNVVIAGRVFMVICLILNILSLALIPLIFTANPLSIYPYY